MIGERVLYRKGHSPLGPKVVKIRAARANENSSVCVLWSCIEARWEPKYSR